MIGKNQLRLSATHPRVVNLIVRRQEETAT